MIEDSKAGIITFNPWKVYELMNPPTIFDEFRQRMKSWDSHVDLVNMNNELDTLYKQCNELELLMKNTKEQTTLMKRASGKILDGMHALGQLLKKEIIYCSICMNRPRRTVCNPCGHTQCLQCAAEIMKEKKCFTCRSEVENTFKIYL